MSRNFVRLCVSVPRSDSGRAPSPSISLIPSEKARAWEEEDGRRRSGSGEGEGLCIWEAHLEWAGSSGGGRARWRGRVPGPSIPALLVLKVPSEPEEGGILRRAPPSRHRKCRSGRGHPGDSRGGRNAAVGTGPGSKTPSRPEALWTGSTSPCAVTLAGPHVPGGWTGPRLPAPSGSRLGAVLPLPRRRGLRPGWAPDLGCGLPPGQQRWGASLPTPFRPRPTFPHSAPSAD